jgi:phage terminase large subunit
MSKIIETKVLNDTFLALNRKYKLIVQQGGTYSGKTFGILVAIALYLQQNKTANLKCRIVGQSVPELEAGAYKDWQQIMEIMPIATMTSKPSKVWAIGNNLIKFTSVDKLGKAKSGKWSLTYINEANHIPWDIAEQLLLKSEVKMIDYNPTGKFWFHKHIATKIEVYEPYLFQRTTYLDNPSLSKDKIREIESITDPYKRSAYVLGELAQQEGIIFPNHKSFTGNLPFGNHHAYCLDFGFTNDVTALSEVCLHGGEIYAMEHIYQTGLLTKDLNALMIERGIKKNIPIIADNIPKEIAELRQYGWTIIPAYKPAGSVLEGIRILEKYWINCHNSSDNLDHELKNYTWLKDKTQGIFKNVPLDANNHLLDGIRYWAYTFLNKKSNFINQMRSSNHLI